MTQQFFICQSLSSNLISQYKYGHQQMYSSVVSPATSWTLRGTSAITYANYFYLQEPVDISILQYSTGNIVVSLATSWTLRDISILQYSTECNGGPFPILLRLLQEDSSGGKVRAICLYTEWQAIVRGDKNGLGGHCTFEGFEGYLLSICPLPRLVLWS